MPRITHGTAHAIPLGMNNAAMTVSTWIVSDTTRVEFYTGRGTDLWIKAVGERETTIDAATASDLVGTRAPNFSETL